MRRICSLATSATLIFALGGCPPTYAGQFHGIKIKTHHPRSEYIYCVKHTPPTTNPPLDFQRFNVEPANSQQGFRIASFHIDSSTPFSYLFCE